MSAGTIGIVPAVGRGIEIETFVKIGKIKSSAAGINVNITGWVEVGPHMRVAAQYADGKIVGDSVINARNKTSGCKVVTSSDTRVVNRYPVAPTVRPKPPNVFPAGVAEPPVVCWLSLFLSQGTRRRSRRDIGNIASRVSLDLVEAFIQLEPLSIGC